MTKSNQKMGFTYFSSSEQLVDQQLDIWMPSLQASGGAYVIFQGSFDVAIPEDAFIYALRNEMKSYVHFNVILPSAKTFNDTSLLLDIYKKWGCEYVILGDKPNIKHNWSLAEWQYDTLVERFLDRFIPLAYHSMRVGLKPVLAPLQPGGDYWDYAFLELLLDGLYQRKMTSILEHLTLASYGYTYSKPLSWGTGGPEHWPGSFPYQTPEGQEDQIGFNNFAWVQAAGERLTGSKMPVIILDAGRPAPIVKNQDSDQGMSEIQKIITAYNTDGLIENNDLPSFNENVVGCTFSLDTLRLLIGEGFLPATVEQVFSSKKTKLNKETKNNENQSKIAHYLLLPCYESGVSDAILNKVRPLIKKFRPTVGFSLEEASHATKVSVYPDPYQFSDEQIDRLRAAGCKVEILPDSGIEIATILQAN